MVAPRVAFSPMSYRISIPLLAVLLAGCGAGGSTASAQASRGATASPPVPIPQARPFFIPGEAMFFELTFRDVVAGKAVVAVGEPGRMKGRRVLIVRSLIESAGVARWIKTVRDDIHTWMDAATGVPIEHRGDMTFGSKHMVVSTHFPPGQVVIEYQRDGKRKRIRRQRMPEGEQVHDFHSILGALRAWLPQPGDAVRYYTASGRRIWRSEVRCAGSETVRTTLGMYPALRFEGVAVRMNKKLEPDEKKPPRPFTFWLSDDDKRMPLRLTARTEYGQVAAELVDYQRPERRVSGL